MTDTGIAVLALNRNWVGSLAEKRILAWTSDEAGLSEIGTCGEEALHADVRHAGPNNTTGGQPGAATYWALFLTMCGPAESTCATEPPEAIWEHVAEALTATWPPPEAPKSWRTGGRQGPPPALPAPG